MQEDGFILADSTVAIVGLGLMGGSLALALKGKCRVIGLDSDRAALEAAAAQGAVDEALSGPTKLQADVVVLAAPVPAILEWLRSMPNMVEQRCIVLDIGSTKRAITDAMDELPPRFDPIGGHPVCGREQLGLKNADPKLFLDAPFILTALSRTSSRARAAASQIVEAVGARQIELSADEHDRALAATSHLPFMLAAALALGTSVENAPFVGTGFRSTARLAGTPASMMLGVLRSNRDYVSIALQDFRRSLSLIEGALDGDDVSALEDVLDRCRNSYEALMTAQ